MKFVNYLEPVAPRRADGDVAEIYSEARRDFGRVPEPVLMFSPNPELLAASWASLRETLLAGRAARAPKEAIAAAVATSLRCPWCVDAHTTMLYAAGDGATAKGLLAHGRPAGPHADLVAWARGTAAWGGPPAPFGPELLPDYIGTAVEFHFLARVVLVVLDETFLPGGRRMKALLRRAGAVVLSGNARRERVGGLSTGRLPTRPLPPDLLWASASEPVARAFAALTDCLEVTPHLPEPGRAVVRAAVADWQGEPQSVSSSWTLEHTQELPAELRPSTRLGLLTALAPQQVSGEDISAARDVLRDDSALVSALAWAAWTAARRTGEWISRPARSAPEGD